MHQPKSTDGDKQCDRLDLAVESASNLHLLWVHGCWCCVYVGGHYYSNRGFCANIENDFCFVCLSVNICVNYSTFYMTEGFIFPL